MGSDYLKKMFPGLEDTPSWPAIERRWAKVELAGDKKGMRAIVSGCCVYLHAVGATDDPWRCLMCPTKTPDDHCPGCRDFRVRLAAQEGHVHFVWTTMTPEQQSRSVVGAKSVVALIMGWNRR